MSDPNKTISYAESVSINYKLSNLKRLFKKKYIPEDDLEVKRINKGSARRGVHKGSVIDAHIRDGSLDAVFQSIAAGHSLVSACEQNGLIYMTFCSWRRRFPLLEEQFQKAKALGNRARETAKHFPEENKDKDVITRPHFKPPTPSEIDHDIRTLTQEQLISVYGENSIVLEYAAKMNNPHFLTQEDN